MENTEIEDLVPGLIEGEAPLVTGMQVGHLPWHKRIGVRVHRLLTRVADPDSSVTEDGVIEELEALLAPFQHTMGSGEPSKHAKSHMQARRWRMSNTLYDFLNRHETNLPPEVRLWVDAKRRELDYDRL